MNEMDNNKSARRTKYIVLLSVCVCVCVCGDHKSVWRLKATGKHPMQPFKP